MSMMALDLRRGFTAALLFVVLLCATAGLVDCTPAVVPSYEPSCAGACARARELCGPTTLTPRTGTCEDVCRVTEQGGGDFHTTCLAGAKTCPDIKACSR
jgi:hypothetical protein